MKPAHDSKAQSPPSHPSTAAETHSANDTAQPPLTSGFGSVMDHERDLQESTEAYLRVEDGVHATSLRHVLREQSAQLSGNIALLEQRYEALPHPERFRGLHGRIAPGTSKASDPRLDPLRPLIAQHRSLLADIATLIMHGADGQRGELILAEVARSHEEMAGTLTTLAFPNAAAHDALPVRAIASAEASRASEGRWETDGGAPRSESAGLDGRPNGGR